VKPLKPGTLRAHLYRLTHASALLTGRPVTFARDDLSGAFPRGREQHASLPESYEADAYVLHADDDLRPVE
jgi:hypothetical protein